ncbi:MAG: choice-of-anchor D domain-containing protein [Thermomicrobiales bacterium]
MPLNGVGVAAGTPAASVNPASIDFGDTQVSTFSGAQAVTLTNTGAAPLTLSNVPDLIGADSALFAIVADGCGTSTLAPGASCTVTVRFGPGSTGAKSAALRFRTDASGSPHLVNLTGNSVAAPVTAPFASLSVGALGTGDQLVNTRSGAQAITITNTGTATLTLTAQPALFGGDTSQFEIVADGCWAGSGSLAPGASCTVTVRFFPGSAGQKLGTALRHQHSGSPHLVNLTGNGVMAAATAPAISFAPAAVTFGSQAVGTLNGAPDPDRDQHRHRQSQHHLRGGRGRQ